ncbi:MAG: YheT family hydrolase [Cyanobacteriota bacterium]
MKPPRRTRDPQGRPLQLPLADGGALLAWHSPLAQPRALVVLLHGLGGDSDSPGVRRLAALLLDHDLAVLRLNLRGAGAGRPLAPGTYAAACNADMLPALREVRRLAAGTPLLAVGFSLGGTVLLNASLAEATLLDGLACVSSPLDLAACIEAFEAPRNRLYHRWMLGRLRRQARQDPGELSDHEARVLEHCRSLRQFDDALTAPRWGHANGAAYYAAASPLERLAGLTTPTLLLQAADDPWVPATALRQLQPPPQVQTLLTASGGHNGFHDARGCWSDRLVLQWLQRQLPTGDR